MRKSFFIFCLLAFGAAVIAPVQAQWRVGASGGATYNWYAIDTQYQTDYRYDGAWGWTAGLFGQYNFKDWVGLRAEVVAMERNYRFYRTGSFSGTNYVSHNTYVQVPVMAQFSFGGTRVRGFVHTGVYGGYWAAGREKGHLFDHMSGRTHPVDAAYVFQDEKDQRWDFGLAGGLGVEWLVAPHWMLHAEGRCYYSFVSTVKQYQVVKDYRYHTTIGMSIGVAYVF